MKVIERIEALVIYAMIAMLLVAIVLGTVALGRLLGEIIVRPPMAAETLVGLAALLLALAAGYFVFVRARAEDR